MMNEPAEATIRVRVDPTNPGQFFACCGLAELADRLWPGVEVWFADGGFIVRPGAAGLPIERTLGGLLGVVVDTSLLLLGAAEDLASPLQLADPFDLRLDWWMDARGGGDRLKVWAGSMRSARIARAMQQAMHASELHNDALFDYGTVVYDPDEPDKKVEPFYFDARRGANALAIDIGFAPDSLHLTSTAYPAVEFLCLVGLQRFRPMPTDRRRIFEYYTWRQPLATAVAAAAACGALTRVGNRGFRFENGFRTDQRKHKAFNPATPFTRR